MTLPKVIEVLSDWISELTACHVQLMGKPPSKDHCEEISWRVYEVAAEITRMRSKILVKSGIRDADQYGYKDQESSQKKLE